MSAFGSIGKIHILTRGSSGANIYFVRIARGKFKSLNQPQHSPTAFIDPTVLG